MPLQSSLEDIYFFFYYKLRDEIIISKISNNYTMKDAKYIDALNDRCINGKLVIFKNDSLGNIISKINELSEYIKLGDNLQYRVINDFIEVDGNVIKANIILPL